MNDNFLDLVWKNNPEYIRKFYDNHPRNESLCNEIKYILSTELDKEKIEYAHVIARAKELKSFCEKISRKSYKNPFDDITDFSGVRVVYLYSSDQSKIESVIEEKFEVVEKVDKVSDEDVDRFGYGALHYLVKMKNTHSGARYDDLKNLICEIQVRTILQDSWAIVAHHLSYKQESDVPKELRRKLNALSGLFETADDQFENIRLARLNYQTQVKESIASQKDISLNEEINLDNLDAYLRWKLPERKHHAIEDVADLLEELNEYGYSKLIDIDNIVDKAFKAVHAYEAEYPPTEEESNEPCSYTSVGVIRTSLSLINEEYLKNKYGSRLISQRNEFLDLVE